MVIIKKLPACVSCRKRKVGCTRERPACANCIKRGEKCCYPDNTGQIEFHDDMMVHEPPRPSKSLRFQTMSDEERASRRNARRNNTENPMELNSSRKATHSMSPPISLQDSFSTRRHTPEVLDFVMPDLDSFSSSSMNGPKSLVPYTDGFTNQGSNNVFQTNEQIFSNINNSNNNNNNNNNNIHHHHHASNDMYNTTQMTNEMNLAAPNTSISTKLINGVPVFDDIYEILKSDKYDNLISYSQDEVYVKQIDILNLRLEYLKKMRKRKNMKIDRKTLELRNDSNNNNKGFVSKKTFTNNNVIDTTTAQPIANGIDKDQEHKILSERLLSFINNKYATSTVEVDSELFNQSFKFKLFKNCNASLFTFPQLFRYSNELKKFYKELFKQVKLKNFVKELDSKMIPSITELDLEPAKFISFPEKSFECGNFWCGIFENDFINENRIFPTSLFSIYDNFRKFSKKLNDFEFVSSNPALTSDFITKCIEYSFVLLWCYYSIAYSSIFPQFNTFSPYYNYYQQLALQVPQLKKNLIYAQQYLMANQSNKFISLENKSRLLLLSQLYNTYFDTDFENQLNLLNPNVSLQMNELNHLQLTHFLNVHFFQGNSSIQLQHLNRFYNVKQVFLNSVKENHNSYSYQQLEDMLLEWKTCLEENSNIQYNKDEDEDANDELDGLVPHSEQTNLSKVTQSKDERTVEELIYDYREKTIYEHASVFINYYKVMDYQFFHFGDQSKLENETDIYKLFLKSCLAVMGTSFEILSNVKLNKYQILVSHFAYKSLLSVITMLFSIRFKNPRLVKTILNKLKLLLIEQTGGLVEKYYYNSETSIALDVFLHYFGYEEETKSPDNETPADTPLTKEPADSASDQPNVNGKDDSAVQENHETDTEQNGEDDEEEEEEEEEEEYLNEVDQVLNEISLLLMDNKSFKNREIPDTYGIQDETVKEIYKLFHFQ